MRSELEAGDSAPFSFVFTPLLSCAKLQSAASSRPLVTCQVLVGGALRGEWRCHEGGARHDERQRFPYPNSVRELFHSCEPSHALSEFAAVA